MRFSADGSVLISASDDNTLRIWDLKSNKEVRRLSHHKERINSVDLSFDG